MLNDGDLEKHIGLNHQWLLYFTVMASPLRHPDIMKRIGAIGTAVILAAMLILVSCYHPCFADAAAEIAPGAVAEADVNVMKELVTAFDQAEVEIPG